MKFGMNLCLWTTAVTAAHFPLLRALKSEGYDSVEVPITRGNPEIFDELRRVLAGEGLQCTTLTNLRADANPVSADSRVRQQAVDNLKWAIDASERLGSRTLSGPMYVASGEFPGSGPTNDELERSAEVLNQACHYAAGARTLLCIEFMNRFETYLVNTTAQALQLVEKVGAENLALVYDTHHAHLEEDDIAAAVRGAGSRIAHAHFSESHRGTLGTGLVDWPTTFQAFQAIGYDGWLMVEAFSTDVSPLARAAHVWRNTFHSKEEASRGGIAFLREHWSKA